MGSFANSLFTLMLGWLQSAASALWSALTNEGKGSFFQWIGRSWPVIVVILCVIGLAVDLGVYLLRWRPFKVWKSFFARMRHSKKIKNEYDDEEGESGFDYEQDEYDPEPLPPMNPHYRRGHERGMRQEYYESAPLSPRELRNRQEADLNRWQEDEPEEEAYIPDEQPVITNAGYSVPADSPYRRPAEPPFQQQPPARQNTDSNRRSPEEGYAEQAPVSLNYNTYQHAPEPDYRAYQEQMPPMNVPPQYDMPPEIPEARTMQRKRKRRLNVGELFSDREDDVFEFDAPQDLIDRNQAYHKPVYPRGWKQSGDDRQ